MKHSDRDGAYDPYGTMEQSLGSGDAINRWVLSPARKKIVQLLKGQRVLDVCCGTGNLTALLAAAGCRVVGVDSSPTMLSFARNKGIAADFLQLDASEMSFEGEFEAAVISIALHEMSPQIRQSVWKSMRRALRPQGRLVALDFAVPVRRSLVARVAHGLIEQDERAMLDIHPEHFTNFQEFMSSGGLLGWIQQWVDDPIEGEYRYWGGTLAVVVAKKSKT